jgi:hypothetical protein
MPKRILLTLDDKLYGALTSTTSFGTKDAEIAKNIIRTYLLEKGYVNYPTIHGRVVHWRRVFVKKARRFSETQRLI